MLIYVRTAGILVCLDGFMNVALEQTEEWVDGALRSKFGDAFLRGNNGAWVLVCLESIWQHGTCRPLMRLVLPLSSLSTLPRCAPAPVITRSAVHHLTGKAPMSAVEYVGVQSAACRCNTANRAMVRRSWAVPPRSLASVVQ